MQDIDALEQLAPSAELRPLQSRTSVRRGDPAGSIRRLGPGLALVAVVVATAFGVSHLVPVLSPLVVSVALGAVLANVGLLPERALPGTKFAAKRLLRLGVVLLGFQLAVGEVVKLGAPGLVVVAIVVAMTFFGTRWFGARLGISPGLSLLMATGFSICGASAIAAVEGVADADEEEVAFSIALVTLCGSLAIALLPLLSHPLGLHGAAYGSWVGASVHDVAQVVATASTGGPAALRTAVIVKLTRVILLAPLVAMLTVARRRRHHGNCAGTAERPPVIPLFVAGFLVAVAIRSTNVMPAAWLDGIKLAETAALAAALVGLGCGVQIAKLRRLGGRPLALALVSWVLVASSAYLGVRLVG